MKISFGTLFEATKKVTLGKGGIYVVLEVGKEDYFYAAKTFQIEGQIAFSLQTGGGTARTESIESITGQLSLQEMIDAARLGAIATAERELNEWEISHMKEYSTRGEREI